MAAVSVRMRPLGALRTTYVVRTYLLEVHDMQRVIFFWY